MQEQFNQAFLAFLQSVELIKLADVVEIEFNGKYKHLCFGKTFYKDDDEEKVPYRLMASSNSWKNLAAQIAKIFENRISQNFLDSTIGRSICELSEFPFTDHQLERFSEEIFNRLVSTYQHRATILVPLYHLKMTGFDPIRLANAIVESGHSKSALAKSIEAHDMLKYEQIIENPYLVIETIGDTESKETQAIAEVNNSLSILRFVAGWSARLQGTKNLPYNPAATVSDRETGIQVYFATTPDNLENSTGYMSSVEPPFNMSNFDRDFADKLGLSDLNYHFANVANSLSQRIIQALRLYDSGTQSQAQWESLYQYVACINIAIPTSDSSGRTLASRLEKLFRSGGQFISFDYQAFESPVFPLRELTWDQLLEHFSEVFERIYQIRSQILHGNEVLIGEYISDEDTERARILAHNVVRVMAHLATELDWQSYREAKVWFNDQV